MLQLSGQRVTDGRYRVSNDSLDCCCPHLFESWCRASHEAVDRGRWRQVYVLAAWVFGPDELSQQRHPLSAQLGSLCHLGEGQG